MLKRKTTLASQIGDGDGKLLVRVLAQQIEAQSVLAARIDARPAREKAGTGGFSFALKRVPGWAAGVLQVADIRAKASTDPDADRREFELFI